MQQLAPPLSWQVSPPRPCCVSIANRLRHVFALHSGHSREGFARCWIFYEKRVFGDLELTVQINSVSFHLRPHHCNLICVFAPGITRVSNSVSLLTLALFIQAARYFFLDNHFQFTKHSWLRIMR